MFFTKKKEPKISVVIPVYNGEKYIVQTIQNVLAQDFEELQIVIVDDGSQNPIDKIVKSNFANLIKSKKIIVEKHCLNEGLTEARRTGINSASGEYIYNLDVDDNFANSQALSEMYEIAKKNDADIVQCNANVISDNEFDKTDLICSHVQTGILQDEQIINNWLIEKRHPYYVWGKLIKKSVYEKAFECIPDIFCTMKEDFLQYFFISLHAKKFVGIPNFFHNYYIGSGLSTTKNIVDLESWNKICSAASVYTTIFDYLSNKKNDNEIGKAVAYDAEFTLGKSILRLKNNLEPKLYCEGLQMLNESWGESFVKRVAQIIRVEI